MVCFVEAINHGVEVLLPTHILNKISWHQLDHILLVCVEFATGPIYFARPLG